MTDGSGELTVLEGEDGFLVLGSDEQLAALETDVGVRSLPLSPHALGQVGVALKGMEAAAAQSGRWFKADAASAAYMKAHKVRNVTSGTLRAKNLPGMKGNQGRIMKHLTFEKAGLASPAAPAVLGAIAMQQALQASLAEITEYLEAIDAKLDALLKQRKTETLGHLGGIAWTIDDAATVYESTGKVSEVTWSKVQANSLALASIQAECIAQLNVIAQSIKERDKDADELAKLLSSSNEDVQFWVGVLARTIALQDRQFLLEVARVEDAEPSDLEAHRLGIRAARENRHAKIRTALEAVLESLRSSTELSNMSKAVNPISAPRVASGANAIAEQIHAFVEHADLGAVSIEALTMTSWAGAVKGLFGETTEQVSVSGMKVAGRARSMTGSLQRRGEAALLAKADKIRQQRATEDTGRSE